MIVRTTSQVRPSPLSNEYVDVDPQETAEWLESLEAVLRIQGPERAQFLLDALMDRAQVAGIEGPSSIHTPYLNTVPKDQEVPYPGDRLTERKIKSLIRWNAMAMVARANKTTNVGGHIATFASAATLYEVGFNHFFRGRTEHSHGDVIYFQGHASPGPYARAFLEGRLTETQLKNFRQELQPGGGLSSYPHPWLMPGLLAVPDRQHGPRADHGDLPGPVRPVPGSPRAVRHGRHPRLGVPRRRRVRRAGNAGLHRHRGPRKARQPDLRRQLQPAAPRRPGPREREDHPGAGGHVPRGRVERGQVHLGVRLGRLWRATQTARSPGG